MMLIVFGSGVFLLFVVLSDRSVISVRALFVESVSRAFSGMIIFRAGVIGLVDVDVFSFGSCWSRGRYDVAGQRARAFG